MANISVGCGTDLSLKAIIKGIRIAIGTVNEDRINSLVKRKIRQSRVEKDRAVRGAADIKEFIALLGEPHAVMMLVPVGYRSCPYQQSSPRTKQSVTNTSVDNLLRLHVWDYHSGPAAQSPDSIIIVKGCGGKDARGIPRVTLATSQ
jgi:hypothetical protein